jgi:outer membrane lipopolysaccharide assembly protein LptE/RlpB
LLQSCPTETHNAAQFRRAARAAVPLALFLTVLALAVLAQGCGYHVAGHAANLPSEWKTVAVPAFKNDTTRYRIEQRFTEATIREFIARTKYHVVQDPASADAVLHGEVLSIETTPVLFNATTGEVTTMLVTVHTKVSLVDNHTEKPVYQDSDMVFRDQYQISTDVNSFFEQQDPALERMSRDLASQIVANVLEGF